MSLPEGYSIRRATTADLETLVMHRREMFRDIGYKDEAAFQDMTARCYDWLRKYIDAGEYLAWLVIAPDGSVAAGAGLWLMDSMPHIMAEVRVEATSSTSTPRINIVAAVWRAS